MSDRPMRLKYLTKMKIILCIFLLCITAVSVFGELQELNGIVGECVKFPAALKIEGNLTYSGVLLGDVTSGRFTARNGVTGRVHWDSSTGFFSLSGLKMEDIGVYTVQNPHQKIITVFQLNVHKGNVPVLKPHLNVTRNEYRCTVLCAAARGTGATLTLYKNGEKNPYVTSPGHSHPGLNMTVSVEGSGTYTCEAKNSVSRETSDPLTVGAHCTAPSSSSAGTIVAIIFAVVAVLIAVVLAVLYHRKRKQLPTYEANQGLIKDAVGRMIADEDNQELIKDAVRSRIRDEDNQGLIKDAVGRMIRDEDNQAFIKDAVRRMIRDEDNQGFIKDAVGRMIRDEDNQGLIKIAVRRMIRDEENQAFIRDAVGKMIEESRGLSKGKK